MNDRDFGLAIRQAILMFLDALERWLIGRGRSNSEFGVRSDD